MTRRGIRLTTGQDLGRLSPCVCNTLRVVARAVTQLYDDVLRPSGLKQLEDTPPSTGRR